MLVEQIVSAGGTKSSSPWNCRKRAYVQVEVYLRFSGMVRWMSCRNAGRGDAGNKFVDFK